MRIVSWNCGGGFRSKFQLLDHLAFDVCVIQECEEPNTTPISEYREWAGQHLWVGENRNKGIGVFFRNQNQGKISDLSDGGNKLFLPFILNNGTTILAVWTKGSKRTAHSYVGQIWGYLNLNMRNIDTENCLVIGDFNSNAAWDNKRPEGNHSHVVDLLKSVGLDSLYHIMSDEQHGSETIPTFYMYRDQTKGYHIDYCFASKAFASKPYSLEFGEPTSWLNNSDHIPLILEF
jgi:exonuclease III